MGTYVLTNILPITFSPYRAGDEAGAGLGTRPGIPVPPFFDGYPTRPRESPTQFYQLHKRVLRQSSVGGFALWVILCKMYNKTKGSFTLKNWLSIVYRSMARVAFFLNIIKYTCSGQATAYPVPSLRFVIDGI